MEAHDSHAAPLRWAWIAIGVFVGAGLITVCTLVVDPGLERPELAGLIATCTLILAGIVLGRVSPGETIREAAVSAVVVFGLVAAYLVGVRGGGLPGVVWVAGPFYAASLAMLGAWVGEMLQGTLEEAHEDRAIDWPWIFVSVVCGSLIVVYALAIGGVLLPLEQAHVLPIFFLSVLATGWLVAFFSPGYTAVEPAIASLVMVVVCAGMTEIWFRGPMPLAGVAIGAAGGLGLGLIGGWLGEVTQAGPRAMALRQLVRGF